jgi:hypothetical protein
MSKAMRREGCVILEQWRVGRPEERVSVAITLECRVLLCPSVQDAARTRTPRARNWKQTQTIDDRKLLLSDTNGVQPLAWRSLNWRGSADVTRCASSTKRR